MATIWRDVYCPTCSGVYEDVEMDRDASRVGMWCVVCQCRRDMEIVCNGGTGMRYRTNDWPTDPEFYRGQVKALDVTAKDSDGVPIQRYDSQDKQLHEVMHEAPRYRDGTDTREIRRDKIMHDSRRTRGRLPILFDMRGKRIKNAR